MITATIQVRSNCPVVGVDDQFDRVTGRNKLRPPPHLHNGLWIPGHIEILGVEVGEVGDYDVLGRVNDQIARIYCVVTRGIGLLSVVDFDTCITKGIGQLVVLGLRFLFVYVSASFNRCPRVVSMSSSSTWDRGIWRITRWT